MWTKKQQGKFAVGLILGGIGAYLGWLSSSMSAAFPWWLAYVLATGIYINDFPDESPGFLISAGLGSSFIFIIASVAHLLFVGHVALSGENFYIHQIGWTDALRVSTIFMVTLVGIVVCAYARNAILSLIVEWWKISARTLRKIDARVKIGVSIMTGLAVIFESIKGLFD